MQAGNLTVGLECLFHRVGPQLLLNELRNSGPQRLGPDQQPEQKGAVRYGIPQGQRLLTDY